MLDPDLVLAAVVDTFRSITAVTDELAGDPAKLIAHQYAYGEDNSLARAVYEMSGPSVLIAYMDLIGGDFDGSNIWKHRLEVYIRAANRLWTNPQTHQPPATPLHLWWLMMHELIPGTNQNIRQFSLLASSLRIPDTPTLLHRSDETGADYFVGQLVFPENGDD